MQTNDTAHASYMYYSIDYMLENRPIQQECNAHISTTMLSLIDQSRRLLHCIVYIATVRVGDDFDFKIIFLAMILELF